MNHSLAQATPKNVILSRADAEGHHARSAVTLQGTSVIRQFAEDPSARFASLGMTEGANRVSAFKSAIRNQNSAI